MRGHPLAAVIRSCLLTVALLGALSGVSHAGPNADAKILLHLLAPTTKYPCTRAEATPPCSSIVTAGDLYPNLYYAYVLVTDADSAAGVAGVQFGIDYDGQAQSGVDIFQWFSCTTLQFPTEDWPESESGNLLTWNLTNACQRSQPHVPAEGVLAVAGYFYCASYSDDVLSIIPHVANGLVTVVDCNVQADTLAGPEHGTAALGSLAFSDGATAAGSNPCGQQSRIAPPPPVLPSASRGLPYDPEIHSGPVPSSVLIGKNRMLILDTDVFIEGDRLDLGVGEKNEVLVNSTPIRRLASPPQPTQPATELDIWLDTFYTVFALATGADEDRLKQAINAAGGWFVADSPPPVISNGHVKLFTSTGLQYRLDTNPPANLDRAARNTDPSIDLRIISRLLSEDESESWLVLRLGPSSVSIYSGAEGEVAMQVIRAQLENRLSSSEMEVATGLGMGASLVDRLVRGSVK